MKIAETDKRRMITLTWADRKFIVTQISTRFQTLRWMNISRKKKDLRLPCVQTLTAVQYGDPVPQILLLGWQKWNQMLFSTAVVHLFVFSPTPFTESFRNGRDHQLLKYSKLSSGTNINATIKVTTKRPPLSSGSVGWNTSLMKKIIAKWPNRYSASLWRAEKYLRMHTMLTFGEKAATCSWFLLQQADGKFRIFYLQHESFLKLCHCECHRLNITLD